MTQSPGVVRKLRRVESRVVAWLVPAVVLVGQAVLGRLIRSSAPGSPGSPGSPSAKPAAAGQAWTILDGDLRRGWQLSWRGMPGSSPPWWLVGLTCAPAFDALSEAAVCASGRGGSEFVSAGGGGSGPCWVRGRQARTGRKRRVAGDLVGRFKGGGDGQLVTSEGQWRPASGSGSSPARPAAGTPGRPAAGPPPRWARPSTIPAASSDACAGSRRTVPTHPSAFQVLTIKKPASECAETRTARPSPRRSWAHRECGDGGASSMPGTCGEAKVMSTRPPADP